MGGGVAYVCRGGTRACFTLIGGKGGSNALAVFGR